MFQLLLSYDSLRGLLYEHKWVLRVRHVVSTVDFLVFGELKADELLHVDVVEVTMVILFKIRRCHLTSLIMS